MGSFFDLIEANNRRNHEIRMQKLNSQHNLIAYVGVKLVIFGVLVVAIKKAMR